MRPKPNQVAPIKAPEFSDETLGRMIEQQSKEADVRMLEVDLRLSELKYTSAHAEKILGAQERDRQGEREHERKKDLQKLLFSGFCVVLLFVMIVVGMYLGKDEFVSDILKVLVGVIAGAAGGYSYSKVQAKSDQD